MAVGTARPAIRHREPAWRRRQHRHRGSRACARRRLYAPRDRLQATRSTLRFATLYEKLNFNFVRDIAPVAAFTRQAQRHGGESIVSGQDAFPSSSPMPRRIRARSAWRRMASGPDTCRRRAVQDDDRRQHGARSLSWRGVRDSRPDRRTGAGHVHLSCLGSIEYIRAGKLRALAVTTAARSEALPDMPTVGEFVPGYEVSAWFGIGAPTNTPAEIVDKLNREINAALADPKMKARTCRHGSHGVCQVRRPTSASSSPTKPRSGPRSSSSLASRPISRLRAALHDVRQDTRGVTFVAAGRSRFARTHRTIGPSFRPRAGNGVQDPGAGRGLDPYGTTAPWHARP